MLAAVLGRHGRQHGREYEPPTGRQQAVNPGATIRQKPTRDDRKTPGSGARSQRYCWSRAGRASVHTAEVMCEPDRRLGPTRFRGPCGARPGRSLVAFNVLEVEPALDDAVVTDPEDGDPRRSSRVPSVRVPCQRHSTRPVSPWSAAWSSSARKSGTPPKTSAHEAGADNVKAEVTAGHRPLVVLLGQQSLGTLRSLGRLGAPGHRHEPEGAAAKWHVNGLTRHHNGAIVVPWT